MVKHLNYKSALIHVHNHLHQLEALSPDNTDHVNKIGQHFCHVLVKANGVYGQKYVRTYTPPEDCSTQEEVCFIFFEFLNFYYFLTFEHLQE